ncbi:alkyl/aryl-sulfatase [Pseudomonas laurylsulfatiphila]|uniref:alkyl/aryl-sulfatase n=1 Tax=Pseudomonas laurylsulfatiphila TaxID=2011015 RepID=UPI0021604FC0|nr:alkyl sulfatase dimerization domain-containing protein [Pseudomonas laurylsulfatiphila]UVM02394.1 MBL fold metallo-hydrolase [Pseudomonas laurylsulfatiphila]
MKKIRVVLTVSVLAASIVGALQWSRGQTGVHLPAVENSAGQGGQKAATAATIAANATTAHTMPAVDPQVEADIQRGFIASLPDAETTAADGHVVYSLKGYEFLDSPDAPATVNPSLWQQARKSMANGLFKVTDGFYQVRGLDLTNMTIIEGKTGLIIIDCNLATEVAHASLELYYQHRPRKPVVAVFYNHSHVDHFAGIRGIVDEEDVKSGKVQIIAPAGFMETSVAENVMAGNAMSRRAEYQFGTTLPRSAQGQIDLGGAKALSNGTITMIPPTLELSQPVQTLTIDGVEIVNMLAPGTEAPAEFIHYFPQFKVIDTGELALPTQHQLLTLRGATIRDGLAWSKYLNQSLHQFAPGADILVGQHGWPVFGHERVVNYLSKQRDMYKWLHDQSLRLINKGYKPVEIAEYMRDHVPASLASETFTHGFYGSVQRNAKAVYQQYMGWYDANPANLDALSDGDYGKKFVEYGGGADAVLARARSDFANGQYRWVAQAMSHLTYAEPTNSAARELAADALEQLGYQAESAVERNSYLAAAMEHRSGGKKLASPLRTASPDMLRALTIENIFDYLGVRLKAPDVEGKHIVLNWNFTDIGTSGKRYMLNLENSALTYIADYNAEQADATLTLTRETLNAILAEKVSPIEAVFKGDLKIDGSKLAVYDVLGSLDKFSPDFELVGPNAPAR